MLLQQLVDRRILRVRRLQHFELSEEPMYNFFVQKKLVLLKKRTSVYCKCGGTMPRLPAFVQPPGGEMLPGGDDAVMVLCMACNQITANRRATLVSLTSDKNISTKRDPCYYIVCGCEDERCKLLTRVFVPVSSERYLRGLNLQVDANAIGANGHRLRIRSRTVRVI